jgi:hypothetical protein
MFTNHTYRKKSVHYFDSEKDKHKRKIISSYQHNYTTFYDCMAEISNDDWFLSCQRDKLHDALIVKFSGSIDTYISQCDEMSSQKNSLRHIPELTIELIRKGINDACENKYYQSNYDVLWGIMKMLKKAFDQTLTGIEDIVKGKHQSRLAFG